MLGVAQCGDEAVRRENDGGMSVGTATWHVARARVCCTYLYSYARSSQRARAPAGAGCAACTPTAIPLLASLAPWRLQSQWTPRFRLRHRRPFQIKVRDAGLIAVAPKVFALVFVVQPALAVVWALATASLNAVMAR